MATSASGERADGFCDALQLNVRFVLEWNAEALVALIVPKCASFDVELGKFLGTENNAFFLLC